MTVNLTEFLTARLDEDERDAKAAADEPPTERQTRYPYPDRLATCILNGRHGPARVLREVEAKRRIVNSFQTAAGADRYGQPNEFMDGYTTSLEIAVHALAAVYSDHPDYDPAWA